MTTLTPARKACNGTAGIGFSQPERDVHSGGQIKAVSTGPLGINAKSHANRMDTRVARFSLQSVARSILPKSRTAKCLRIRPSTPKFKSGNIMNMEQRLMLAFKRVVLFGRALFALQRLPKGVEVNYRRLWQCIGQELERSRS